jgi:hypothetical protein
MKSLAKQYFRERVRKLYAPKKIMVYKSRRRGYSWTIFNRALKKNLELELKIKSKFKQLGL